jgi:predicted dehydrogenase
MLPIGGTRLSIASFPDTNKRKLIRAAIVGLGTWGRHLVESVQGASPHIRFTAGTTATLAKAAPFAAAHGIALRDTYDEVLADDAIDAVVLATPHTQHTQQILAAAAAGKPVFTEKPLGLSHASARAAVAACADRGVTCAVGYNWRFQPALREMKRRLDDGRLGSALHLEGNFCGPSAYRFGREHWRQQRDEGPAGGMTGRGVHVIDAMLYLAGRIVAVTAQSKRLAHSFGIDDTTSMLLEFASGATGYLGTVIATAETWRLQVLASKGWAEVGGVEHLTTWPLTAGYLNPADVTVKPTPQVATFGRVSTERAELEHFAHAVEARQPLALPDGDEVHNVAVLEAILASVTSRTRMEVQ